MKKILAYRFSAFGDVAMTAVVFREILEQNNDLQIIMVSREHFRPLFSNIPNLIFKGIKIEDYKGFFGLKKLSKELSNEFAPDAIADLHDVIRTKILNFFFRKKGYKIEIIDKEKKNKEQLTDVWNLNKFQLKPTVERYADVFRALGFSVTLSHQYRIQNTEKNGIGFAPFAQHKGKMMPLQKSFQLAQKLSENHKIYFFGGGKKEVDILNEWQKKISNSENLAGKLTLTQELEKISQLQLMISMDSANMHLASLVGTRCLSIWGATHHFAGFLGYGQNEKDIIQVKDLTCRPCSVFGDKQCYRGDYACLHELKIEDVLTVVDGK